MVYVPNYVADVFISYSHDDDYAWIERFQQDLKTALVRKLRARVQPAIFFDTYDLRAGRVFDEDIRTCLEKTAFFVAIVSPRYNSSEYCIHKEVATFLRQHSPEKGHLIQVHVDRSATLPVDKALAVPFFDDKGMFRPDNVAYDNALRRVSEPIVSELDKLYAGSKMVFLAWPCDSQLEGERKRLISEIEGRNLRVFPVAIADYEGDVRLRDALQQCATSVHFFGYHPQAFDRRQWEVAVQLNKPVILASLDPTEARRGPAGSPPPIYLGQGNPTIGIAGAVENVVGIGRREESDPGKSLGRTPVFLSFKEDSDAMVGLKLRKHIMGCGPFEVIVPPPDRTLRFQEFNRAKAALVCRPRGDGIWLGQELKALYKAVVEYQMFDVRRALFLPDKDSVADVDMLGDDAILHSEQEVDAFLHQLEGAAS